MPTLESVGSQEDRNRKAEAEIAALPFEHLEVSGEDAFAAWEGLRAEGRGWPTWWATIEIFWKSRDGTMPDRFDRWTRS